MTTRNTDLLAWPVGIIKKTVKQTVTHPSPSEVPYRLSVTRVESPSIGLRATRHLAPPLTEIGAEAGHKVPCGNHVHSGVQRLQDQLEASADLFLADLADSADLLPTKQRDAVGTPKWQTIPEPLCKCFFSKSLGSTAKHLLKSC